MKKHHFDHEILLLQGGGRHFMAADINAPLTNRARLTRFQQKVDNHG